MIIEKLWEFSDHQVGVSSTTAISDVMIDTTSDEYKVFHNMAVPLWIIVTCNVVGAGTSTTVKIYQHSTTTLTSGDLLMTGRLMAVADQSVNPRDPGHYLFAVPLMSCLCTLQDADVDRYIGIVYDCDGNCGAAYYDAYLTPNHPPIPTTQITASNI